MGKLARRVGMGMGARAAVVAALIAGGASCGEVKSDGPAAGDGIEQVQGFVTWLSASDPLVTEHTGWHLNGCGNPGGRSCTNQGANFLQFHREFLRRLRAKFNSLGLSHDISPWYRVPPEMRTTANGWTPALTTAEANLYNNFNPSTGAPFANVNAFGTYLENNFHNFLHGIAQTTYGEASIGPINMSPTSTYFFKIHGLVEYLYQRFETSDMNHDGIADMMARNNDAASGGTNFQGQMTGTGGISWLGLQSVPWDDCRWFMVAAADFDLDGNKDIVWQGFGCNLISIWHMNGTTHVGTDSVLTGPGTGWTIVTANDFNGDLMPDLLISTQGGIVQFWNMNRESVISTRVVTLPSGFAFVGTAADPDDNGRYDLIARSGTAWRILYLDGTESIVGAGSRPTSIGDFGMFGRFIGAGRHHAGSNGSYSDLVWWSVPPCNCNTSTSVLLWDPARAGTYTSADFQQTTSFTRNWQLTSAD